MFIISIIIAFSSTWCFHSVSSESVMFSASFYGGSYVHVPLQDAKSTTEVQLKFRTKQSEALLLLAAGRTDYCLIRLEAGRLKVHINLGAGETEVASPKGLKLNDLTWHQVVVSRTDANITLLVDQIHVTREKLPGKFFELNIHYGVYVGGQGDFSELFLGHGEWLRGCLADVVYNGVQVLQRARQRTGKSDAQGVTWNCAAEFDASLEQDISYVEDGAYIALPNIINRTGVRWEVEIKTSFLQGVLLYSSGLSPGRSDYVGVEVVGGQVRVTLDKGNGAVELTSDTGVSDGVWHNVAVKLTPSIIDIAVDGHSNSLRLAHSGSRYFDLSDTVYIGGMELNKRARALGQGLKAADTSFKGCMRLLAADGKRFGIPNAKVTQGILPECVWSYMCTQNPCAPDAKCVQQGVDSFRCECLRSHCLKEDYATSYKVFSKTSQLELVELSPVSVVEGQNALLTPAHMNVVLDYAKYGVRDSGVLFLTVGAPEHGRLAVEVWERGGQGRDQQVFTLLDLAKDKVRYLHDGSESTQDSIMMDLELAPGPGFIIPGYLQGKHRFILHVDISPVNDPPTLNIPSSRVLRLAQGTRKKLGRELLNATDPDTVADSLLYSVLGNSSGGIIERTDNPDVSITSFTQAEVDDGTIYYRHTRREPGNSKLALQVSDGIDTSPVSFLHISVFPLQLQLENNTGAVLTHNSWTMISPANLSYTTNADDPSLLVHYQVVSGPHCGTLQKQILAGQDSWYKVDSFTSHELALGEIRYVACAGTPRQDNFTMQVSAAGVVAPSKPTFKLTFTELHLQSVNNAAVVLDSVRDAVVTEANLLYTTTPLPIDPTTLTYEVVGLPRYGTLSVNNSVLRLSDVFSQQDVAQGRLRYKLLRTAYSHVTDGVMFRVSAPQCQALAPDKLRFLHTPPSQLLQRVSVVLNILKVVEGGSALLSHAHLDISMLGLSSLQYELTHAPAHGWVDVVGQDGSVSRPNTSTFTAAEVGQHRVRYTHDGSETQRDVLQFVAVSTREEDFLYVGELEIAVNLTNDNAPVRAVDRVFRVVQGGERLLTGRDLRYIDADVDCTPANILYTRKDITNGGIYAADEPNSPLYQFTQADLDAGRVLFRHSGETESRVLLLVSDGVHHTEGMLEVNASPPYVEIVNNTRLVVRQGGSAGITSHNLYTETNVNLAHQQIRFDVSDGPSQGVLELEGSLDPVKVFVQDDIINNKLSYRHNGDVTSVQDSFLLKVSVEGAETSAQFQVRVFPAGYWDPLTVANNQTLHVEESTSVPITEEYLQVRQPHVPPSDITYLVVEPPRYGYLDLDSDEAVTTFSQETVNSRRLHYVQAAANQTRDHMVLTVTNGITQLTNLLVSFLVVPERLYIGGGELRCEEGGNVTLPPSLLPPLTEYYVGRLTEYRLARPLHHGRLVSAAQPARTLTRWSPQQMQAGLIQYVHDGSETTEEVFSVVAKAGDKESHPARVKVIISLVNDQVPLVINNTVLRLWRGGSQTITSAHLGAEDRDSPPENITFAILSATAGHIALAASPHSPIDKFTQAQINNLQLVFVHSGEAVNGEVDLAISDGANSVGPIIFKTRSEEVTLHLLVNKPLNVFPLLRRVVTAEHLHAECSDPSRQVMFRVRSQPTLGQLVLEPDKSPVLNFTQSDVTEGRVSYQHTTPQNQVFTEHATNDSFTFDVVATHATPLLNQDFQVDISVWSGGLDEFLDTTYSLEVEEGGHSSININTTLMMKFLSQHVGTPTITAKLWVPPSHGAVCYHGNCGDNRTTFSNWELNNGWVEYHHDHSDTLQDSVSLSLYLEPGDVLLCNITVPVRVRPVNDQPFQLITQAPHVKCVQGQRRTVTKLDLLTEDDDTPPTEIVYEIVSGPSHGVIAVGGNTTVGRFTQADIDSGRVVFEHSGPLQPASFYFRVSDGQFNPAYTVFNIAIIPVTLNVSVVTPVLLQQGSSVAVITSNVFLINTNGREDSVVYNVTKSPYHGVIYVDDIATNRFKQSDLNTRRVMYMQTDMTTHSDTFELAATFPLEDAPVVTGLNVNMSVEPLIKLGKFFATAGNRTKLTTEALDASPLAKLTNSDPTFKVLKKPRFGRLKKIIYSSGEKRTVKEKEVTRFTHEEVRSGVIYYCARRIQESQTDSFPFLLAASIFQPAIGEMRFDVVLDTGYPSTTFTPPKPPRLPGPKPPIGHEGVEIASPNMSDDYLLVVGMVVGTIILAIIVVMLVRCGSKRAESLHSAKSDLNAPLPLPQPPDELLPLSPHPKRSDSMTPGSLPQCKVIPLGPTMDSVTGSETELNLRYPYGAADEDWSSYEASEMGYSQRANNPMLRRNQYWV
ncbi:chondroitin sulfate proteoglycan 4 [Macrosteles quadrilineatus]|uniref:chondroitin sulfate proteoglycan 4 n=1 Tax=Macrosteles quadrilineatus TaxID=74068 RepID=UPI0023E26B7F|nr:chondroitin sulfate proteoglycan 4 [Macrosteles quadrilineatus]